MGAARVGWRGRGKYVRSRTAASPGHSFRITRARERKMTVTVDLTLCKHPLEMAEAAGFPDSLPLDERARLGFALNDDDDLAAEIERNWLLECRAGGGQST